MSHSMIYDVQLALDITGYAAEPEAISNAMECVPYYAGKQGSRDGTLNLPRQNIWSIRSFPATADASVEEHWAWLYEHLHGKTDILNDLKMPGNIRITIIVRASGRVPPLIIPVQMSQFCADCDAMIDVDISE